MKKYTEIMEKGPVFTAAVGFDHSISILLDNKIHGKFEKLELIAGKLRGNGP